jgi:heme/copper-type cytochrome/quinol oxidase subunit 2
MGFFDPAIWYEIFINLFIPVLLLFVYFFVSGRAHDRNIMAGKWSIGNNKSIAFCTVLIVATILFIDLTVVLVNQNKFDASINKYRTENMAIIHRMRH